MQKGKGNNEGCTMMLVKLTAAPLDYSLGGENWIFIFSNVTLPFQKNKLP